MKLNYLLPLITGAITLSGPAISGGAETMRDYIASTLPGLEQCSVERIAVENTISSLEVYSPPSEGKFVLVNIPSGMLTGYEDGEPVLQMKIIVGKESNQTPVQNTNLTEVRLNPTWTVPYSIIRDERWHDRLNSDPDFFLRNNFEFRDSDGDLLTLEEAQENPSLISRFVQAPGRYNALGEFRFNIQSSEAIYLHDTRDREVFYDNGPIDLSHGCVRLEEPQYFAQWLLNMSEDEVNELRRDGSTQDIRIPDPVPISMEYFTAWPDANGDVIIYDDIYNRNVSDCYSEWDW